jgi:hypothetical protein
MYLLLHSIARPTPDANMLLYGCEVSAFSVGGQLTLPLVRWARANVFGLRAFARVRWKMAMAYNKCIYAT